MVGMRQCLKHRGPPLLITGPGIVRGRTLSYGEQTDIVPTIAAVLHVAAPNKARGWAGYA